MCHLLVEVGALSRTSGPPLLLPCSVWIMSIPAARKAPMIFSTVRTNASAPGIIPNPICRHAYMINVASAKHGVRYGKWTHIDGFSEQIISPRSRSTVFGDGAASPRRRA